MGIAPNYFPFDVGLWTPADVFREAADDLTVGQRAELVADIYSTLDRVDPQDLSPDQRERFNIRRAKVATTLSDSRLQAAAFSDLERESLQVAIFLRARNMAADVFDGHKVIGPELREKARNAAAFLEERRGDNCRGPAVSSLVAGATMGCGDWRAHAQGRETPGSL